MDQNLICRTCLKTNLLQDNYRKMSAKTDTSEISIKDMLEIFMPEMDLDIFVDELVLCISCSHTLENAYIFKNKCLQTEDKIYEHLHHNNLNLEKKIRLQDIADNEIINNDDDAQQTPKSLSEQENFCTSNSVDLGSTSESEISEIYSDIEDEEGAKTILRKTKKKGEMEMSRSREPVQLKRPHLLSATSDPPLLTPLATNTNNEVIFTMGQEHHNKQAGVKKKSSPIPILPRPPPPTTLIITTPVNITPVQSPSSDPLLLNSFSSSNSPVLDNTQNLNSPTSSQGSIESQNPENRDQRRVGHIHSERKRRFTINNGFDMIHSLIPHLKQNPTAKLSIAAMLQEGAEYIRQLRSERNKLDEEIECLRQEIKTLNTSISNCQTMLPATGAPISRAPDSKMQEMFDDYVGKRSIENCKFWIFSLLFRPLLESFNNFVSTSSLDVLYRSTILWIEQRCTLVDLRPVVLNSLKDLSTKTNNLSEPEKLPDNIRQMVLSQNDK